MGGWVKPQLGLLFFFGNFVFFVLFSCYQMFQKKKKKIGLGGWWVGSDQSEFFSEFWIFFNLTRPLSAHGQNCYHFY